MYVHRPARTRARRAALARAASPPLFRAAACLRARARALAQVAMYFVAMPATGAQGIVQPGFNYFVGAQKQLYDGSEFTASCASQSTECGAPNYASSTGNCQCDRDDNNCPNGGSGTVGDTGFTGNSDGYCDAQGGNGVFCPEHDIFEGNTMAAQLSSHSCKSVTKTNSGIWNSAANAAATGPYFPECDMNGCYAQVNEVYTPGSYGPGSTYTINTLSPFTISTKFDSASDFTGWTTTFGQTTDGVYKEFSVAVTDSNCVNASTDLSYTPSMAAVAQSLAFPMTPTFAMWGSQYSTGGMNWLDSSVCGTPDATCSSNPTGYFGSMSITANAAGSLNAAAGRAARAAAAKKTSAGADSAATRTNANAPNKSGRRAQAGGRRAAAKGALQGAKAAAHESRQGAPSVD